jgi:alcohol dehydrogenase (cytochrome c)
MTARHACRLARATIALSTIAVSASAAAAPAADITVLCSSAFKTVLEELAPQFERATHHTVAVRYGLAAVLKQQIEAGEAFDLAILTPAAIDDLIAHGSVVSSSRTMLARTGLGLAIRAGAGNPDIATVDAFTRTLVSATSIAYAKEGASGVAFAALIERLGIADALKAKSTLTATGEQVGEAVVQGKAQLGVLPVSEIQPVRGAELLGAFPADVQSYIVLVAGIGARAKASSIAGDLVAFLTAPGALPVITAKGMERPPSVVPGQSADGGRRIFVSRCASCHGTDGNGGELGPGITTRVPARTDADLASLFAQGLTASGMPAFPSFSPDETTDLIGYVRTLRPRSGSAPARAKVSLTDGRFVEGLVLNHSAVDMQLLGDDRRLHLLRKDGERYRAVTSQADWPSYNGQTSGSRYSPLTQITARNAARAVPKWIFSVPGASRLQVTPVVVDGVMYVTLANECYALDAGAGREIWHYQRPRTKGLVGNAAGGINRGAAVAGDRVFMVTDHAHIIALNRFTGALLWETEMADWHQNYNATGAPLPVGNLVMAGTSGGDEGVRGFVAAFDQATGRETWRFWTAPRPGEPKADTWRGKGIDHPGATTWLTGTYDPELDMVYWPTGNPSPDLIGDDRPGDNLYSDSVVALDAKTGRLRWHFQFTPHDVWDYDAQETPALVDATWQNRPRKLLVQANRNGFFYVLDRTDGTFLLGRQYAKTVTWASGLTSAGRPLTAPDMEPTRSGLRVCPALDGASNWYSTSFNPATGLYYVQTNDKCGIFTREDMEWQAGKGFMGGSFKQAPDEPAQRVLRAIDIQTGKVAWALPETGAVDSWGGTLSTAGGIVIFGEDSGALMAADAATGAPLWSFQTNQVWKASPMTYMFDNRQYIAVASGPNIIVFGLPEN